MRGAKAGVWIALIFLTAAAPAAARDKTADAQVAYHDGVRLYDLGEFEHALAAFKQAYRKLDSPAFLYNIAQCYRELGNRSEAIRFYQSYLEEVPEADDRERIRRIIHELAKAPPAVVAPAPPAAAPVPPDVSAPAPAARTVAPALVVSAPRDRPRPTPLYRRWWPWTLLAAAVTVGVVAVVVVEKVPNNAPIPNSKSFGVSFP